MAINTTNSSPISTALQSIQRESSKIADNAAKIANGFSREVPQGITEPIIEIAISTQAVEANFAVINRVQRLEDALLDIIA